MLIIIKSPPESDEAIGAVKKAAELAADIVLVEAATALAVKGGLEGFCGTAFVLESDLRAHVSPDEELEKGVKLIDREEMELMVKEDGDARGYF